MNMITKTGVIVSRHAADQLKRRFPGESRDAVALIFHEVHSALAGFRRSKRHPAWAAMAERRKEACKWYVWNENETRCYLLTELRKSERRTDKGFSRTFVVITTLRRLDDDQIEVANHRRRNGTVSFGGDYKRRRTGRPANA